MITYNELRELYNEMLDDIYPVVKAGNITLRASEVLCRCANIEYKVGFGEYIESLIDNELFTEEELKQAGVL